MKLCRYQTDKNAPARYGLLEDGRIHDLSEIYGDQHAELDGFLTAGVVGADMTATSLKTGKSHAVSDVIFLPPIARPGKIFCIGVNYPDRNAEYKDGQAAPTKPSVFVRFPASLTGHEQPLLIPPESEQLDYEGEIAIVIGKSGRRIPQADARAHIAGLTLCNEGTIRDWVRHAKFNVTQGKNFENTGAIGPAIRLLDDTIDIHNLDINLSVNGDVRQSDNTGRMMFPIDYQIAYLSTFITLEPNDIIITGTPSGAGARFEPPIWLKSGDRVSVSSEAIGTLENTVKLETEMT